MDILEKIFGSIGKVKLLRLFLFNPHTVFSVKNISEKLQMRPEQVRYELANLRKMGFAKQKFQRGKGERVVYCLNEKFAFIRELEMILINTAELLQGNLIKRLSKTGRIKLLIVSGIFIQNPESRVDILVVGDGMRKRTLKNVMKLVESEVGKEIRYAVFETSDFNYRISVYDKLIRDILDYPNQRLVDKLGVK